ncbi:MAG: NAD(P)/FAD-dependent oxidoreductase [Terriglobia bacterium]
MAQKADVIVVGGGVIGICTAYYLARKGRTVVLLEKDQICSGCSRGNAGLITPSHAMPIPAPGVIKQACKWMFREDSPLLFRPQLNWQLFSWIIRFAAACREKPMNAAIPVLRDLSRASMKLFEELTAVEGLSFGYERRGLLSVYKTEEGLTKGKREAELLAKHGFKPRMLDGKQARDLEPALRESVIGAIYYEEDAHGDCYKFVIQMSEASKKLGVQIRANTNATRLIIHGNNHIGVITERGEFTGKDVVIATGSWTPQLAKDLGIRIPLQPGKGYSVTMDRLPLSPRIPVLNVAKKVLITPMGNRLRFAGTMEFSGFDLTLNETRANLVLRGGLEVIAQGAGPQNVERWCGLRPCTPDGLPIIDRTPDHPNIYISTGHAMLGYTLGPITGQLVAEMITGSQLSINAGALRIDRF